MEIKIEGKKGNYIVKNSTTIIQQKKDKNGNNTKETIVHVIVDTIEHNEDRILVQKNISKFY